MTLVEAYDILEVDYTVTDSELKEQFRWLVKFYHPDNRETPSITEFRKIVSAYQIITHHRTN